jgi:hypothetical protein
MASPVDISTLIYAAVWAIFNANSNFTNAFPPGNQIRYDQGGTAGNNAVLYPPKVVEQTGDLPQIEMTLDGGMFDSFPEKDKVLGMENAAWNQWIEENNTTRLKIVITGQDCRYTTSGTNTTPGVDQLQAILLDCLRQSGPKLGLNYLLHWGPISWDRRITSAIGQTVVEDTYRFPITSRFGGQAGVLTVP